LNLVANAVDAGTDENISERVKEVTVRTSKKEGWGIEYQVIDNCGGMPDEIKKKIFMNFFSTKGSFGTGIGLMLTKKIVDEHNGFIGFESEEGARSIFQYVIVVTSITFKLKLPLSYDKKDSNIP
jgi:signal transduction histidine kinase